MLLVHTLFLDKGASFRYTGSLEATPMCLRLIDEFFKGLISIASYILRLCIVNGLLGNMGTMVAYGL